ncbi:hypothetical protein [Pseudomonas sp. EA_35y_Pfl2_R5]|uniref:hypothetical protein n=1 Tax=Pseudomonas sp. EA_35y_Pfl2_R5 TaxID=3088690 RepID=UPI0030D70DF0
MPSVAKKSSPRARARAACLLAVLLGSYAVIWTSTEFAAVALSCLGMARSEAVIVSSLLGFVLYPVLTLATLATQRPLWLWGIVAVTSLMLGAFGNWGTN